MAGIWDWPRQLKDVKQVQSTLGVLGYQRPFIKNFATITQPLHDLTKKDMPFNWMQECIDTLKQLIQAIASKLMLYQPDWSKQFELEVQCFKKLIKCLVLLYCFNDISTTRPYYVIYLVLFESP